MNHGASEPSEVALRDPNAGRRLCGRSNSKPARAAPTRQDVFSHHGNLTSSQPQAKDEAILPTSNRFAFISISEEQKLQNGGDRSATVRELCLPGKAERCMVRKAPCHGVSQGSPYCKACLWKGQSRPCIVWCKGYFVREMDMQQTP